MIYKFKKELANIPSFYNPYGIKIETQKSVFQYHHSEKLLKLSKAFQWAKQPWTLIWVTWNCQKKWISIMNNIWAKMMKIIEFKDRLLLAQVNSMRLLLLKKKENKLFSQNKINHKMLLERKKLTLWMMMISLIQLQEELHSQFKFQLPKPSKLNNKILSDY